MANEFPYRIVAASGQNALGDRRWATIAAGLLHLALWFGGCAPANDALIVYTALDSEFSAPILTDFSESSGIEVRPKFDVESTKTVGLAQALIAERARPRCDLFWNNELLHTLRLERLGLLESYEPARAGEFPANSRSPRHAWHGFAARARILLVNTQRLGAGEEPRSILDLAAKPWRGQVGMAKPLFGTTATHAAVLFAEWGPARATEFFRQIKPNVQILSGNKQVAQAVGSGELIWGLTDTDDALAEVAAGRPVKIVYPDQLPDEMGTLFIPNTLAILKNAPHPQHARRLADYLLSPEVETKLSAGPSGQIPLHPGATSSGRVESPATVRAMNAHWDRAGESWEQTAKFLQDEFSTD